MVTLKAPREPHISKTFIKYSRLNKQQSISNHEDFNTQGANLCPDCVGVIWSDLIDSGLETKSKQPDICNHILNCI